MADAARGPWEGASIANGRYQQLATLGEGGMGYVYRAVDGHLQTPVVIKSPRRALLEDAEQISRFEREVRAMIQLSYPHIVPVIDVGRHDGIPFAVMRYMAGGNLEDRMKTDADGRQQPMPLESLAIWLPSIAKALDFVHQQNYLHRDVKPPNILFDSHGHAYLSDFGIIKALGETAESRSSKLTNDGFIVGTVDYMAPELLTDQSIDGRADQYALAASVYQVLSGRLPFEGNTATAIIVQQVNKPPRPLSEIVANLPAPVCAAVIRGLSKAPQQRFPTCTAFAQAVLQGGVVSERSAPAVTPAAPMRRVTIVQPAVHFNSELRATAMMPAVAQASFPATATRAAAAGAPRQAWLIGSAILGVAVIGLGAALLIPSSSNDDSQYEVLEQDPLPRLIEAWNDRANQVENALVVDSQPLRAQPEYANADEFVKLIDARAQQPSPQVRDQIEGLAQGLVSLHKTLAQLTERLDRRLNEQWAKPTSQAGQQRDQLALERRGLQDQESKLTVLQRRLDSLQELQAGAATKKYDAAAIAELAVLRELEAASNSTDRPQIGSTARTRARELIGARNEKLASMALNALVRTGDSAAMRTACDRLANGQPVLQTPLCASLIIAGKPESVAAAAAFMKEQPEAAQQLDVSQLLKCIEGNLSGYELLVEPLAAICTTSDQRLRLVRAQAPLMNDAWGREIEQACKSGLLKTRAEEVIVDFLAHAQKRAYSLTKRLLEQHPDVKLEALTVDELQRVAGEDRELGSQVMEQLLLHGSGPRRSAALQAYRAASLPFNETRLRQRIEKEGIAEPAALLNYLLATDDARCLTLAEFVLTRVPGIEPGKLDFRRVSAAALERDAIRQSLARLSTQVPESGRAWALEQSLRPSFVNRFRAVEATNRRQLADLKLITDVLNGELKVVKGHATLAGTDRGLDVPTSDFPRLKKELNPDVFGPDGKYASSLTSLREELASVQGSVDATLADDMKQIDAYLGGLLELTKVGRELGKVYDFTIAQQLPGVRRELQKRSLDSWSFRFTRGNIETFQRELPRYESLEKTLAGNRAALPGFLLKPPAPSGGKVSASDRSSP